MSYAFKEETWTFERVPYIVLATDSLSAKPHQTLGEIITFACLSYHEFPFCLQP